MTVHGVAGYMSGCRCEQCFSAQRLRERQLAVASEARWASVLSRIEQASRLEVEARKQSSRIRQRQRATEAAEEEFRGRQRSSKRQQTFVRKQDTVRRRAQAAQEAQERYERAVVERDFRWLLAAERRAASSLRTRINRLVGRQDCYELLWRQAKQTRELIELHYRELNDRIDADTGGLAPRDLR